MPTPLEKLVPSYPTPNIEDVLYVELADTSKSAYRPFDVGTPYPDQTRLPGFKFLRQEPISPENDKLVTQIWVKNRFAQDAYNAYRKYVQEGTSFPIYIRTYLTERKDYDVNGPAGDLSTLTTIVGISISTGGTGYEGDDLGHIALSFSGGGGASAAGYGLVQGGVIVAVFLTNGGTGYTSQPNVFAAGGNGDFLAIGLLQPATAFLCSEEAKPAEAPYGNLYYLVTRVYHTLPGPELVQWVWDEQLRLFVKVTKTIVASSTVPVNTPVVAVNGVIVEYQPIDKNRSVQIVSSIYGSDGTPPPSFTYPTVVEHFPLPNEIVGIPYIYYVWAASGDGESFALDLGLFIDIREGFTGPFVGRVTEFYTYTPSLIALPTLTPFNPQAHAFAVGWWLSNASTARASITNFSIPQTIHGALTFGTDGNSGTATLNSITIPATNPPYIPYGDWITINFTEPRPYRYGLFIYRQLEIFLPTP